MEASVVEQPLPAASAATTDTAVCADCRFAQLFALQPRAVCTHPWAARRGSVLPAAQPACGHVMPHDREPITLHP